MQCSNARKSEKKNSKNTPYTAKCIVTQVWAVEEKTNPIQGKKSGEQSRQIKLENEDYDESLSCALSNPSVRGW